MGLCIGRAAAGSGCDFVAIEEALLRPLGGGAAVTQQIVISFDLRTTQQIAPLSTNTGPRLVIGSLFVSGGGVLWTDPKLIVTF